jgi:hypothetical protein
LGDNRRGGGKFSFLFLDRFSHYQP